MGENRRALIIGVPQYELADRFPDLTAVVRKDAALLGDALDSSGYNVEFIGLTPDKVASQSRIRSAISRVCCTPPEDGTVLIHFTGHGQSVDGADLLVPADAQLSWATDPPEVALADLIGLDLAELLKGCKADTVLLTVDACRDSAGPDGAANGGPTTSFPSSPGRVAVLFGCGPGQTCGSDEEHGSHFTRALADALHADTSPRTVGDVITHTIRRTAELARAAGEEQTPNPHWSTSGSHVISKVELCSGRTLQEDWTVAVRDPQLWEGVRCGEDRRERLQEALVRLTGECAQWHSSVQAELPDPWADDDYPVRVLSKGLKPLLAPQQTEGGPLLDPGEFAILAAAPFVREAVYAMGAKDVSRVDPLRLDPATGAAGCVPERVDLEHTFAAHSLIWRKGRELADRQRGVEDRERGEDARAVAAWLLHRHISGKEELWDTYAPQLLLPLAKAMIGDDAPSARIGELTDELVRICRQTGVIPSQAYESDREIPDARWRLDELVHSSDTVTERWRPGELSCLISVAGLLGCDLRELPGVLVDNVGVTNGLKPAEAVESLQALRWRRDRFTRTLDLDFQCPHPAVHAALEVLVDWTDDAVQRIGRYAGAAELLAHLPERITCRKLGPQYDPVTKGDAYGVPLMRFGLAEDEMRELLMGTQLYGDKTLALRELYQNALDACRYRQARLRYGSTGRNIPYSWEGEIVFRQDVDEEGRRYVECEDNGVGMGREALRSTFSRAGRRFEQSREYRREQARWRRADPDLRIYPNSRFGVGVFSYFMLADEISIWTRPTDEYGHAESGQGLRVDIASSGSLFRVRPGEESQPNGGTRVRLYLQGDDVDVADELGKQIWRSDFAMRVEDGRSVRRTWKSDVLYYGGDADAPVRAGRDLWWVPGHGGLLADGVAVGDSVRTDTRKRSAYDWIQHHGREGFGTVVDLRETHKPEISTSRTEIISYDRAWVEQQILDACTRFPLPEWFKLEWLWAFSQSSPEAAVRISEQLLAAGARVASRLSWDRIVEVAIRQVGCFPSDTVMAALRDEDGGLISMGRGHMDTGLFAWRAAVLRAARIELSANWSSLPIPESTAGYPGPQAWESRVDWQGPNFASVRRAAVSRSQDAAQTLGGVLRRLRRYAIAGMAVPAVPDLEAVHRVLLDPVDRAILAERDDQSLFSLWGPQGQTSDLSSVLERFSERPELPLAEALGRARRFAAVGFNLEIPEAVSEAPRGVVATKRDVGVLRWHPQVVGGDGAPGFQPFPSEEEYAEVTRRYGWLGLTSQPAVRDPSMPVGGWLPDGWTREQGKEFERCFGVPVNSRNDRLTLRQLARASGMLSISVSEVLDRYAKIFEAMELPVPDPGDCAARTFSRLDSDLLGAAVPSQRPYEGGRADPSVTPVPLLDTAIAVCGVQADAEEMVDSLTALAAAGLVQERAASLVEDWLALSERDWDLLPEHSGEAEVVDGVGGAYGFAVAGYAEMSLGAAFTRLVALGPLVDLDMSELAGPFPEDLADMYPTEADVEACCGDDAPAGWNIPAPDLLVAHARARGWTLGESVAALSRYAPLGALWRETEDADALWRAHRPTPHDVELFERDLVGDRPVGPLDLLRVAARFGWPMDRAWDRLALYLPFGLELQVSRPELDIIPGWEDLILLTEQYTGRAPALSGEVTAERIAVAARELERPTHWVRDRLALYAQLFGLALPQVCPAEPAPTPTAEPYRADTD
ncbi:hypothetical protein FE633_36225 [Streptomyces montanus]|uniref:Caspase family protein n=1 Tax=Streptomyces montanus TaxID=2580423 RepID=A0A5R9FLJ4_9ACTN|nr:caspase family protein [Streptomyces montanus]TLS41404.1 hypothetical protein FE633_36225 [Streptomyces montanus]